jgi:hypothetical protein
MNLDLFCSHCLILLLAPIERVPVDRTLFGADHAGVIHSTLLNHHSGHLECARRANTENLCLHCSVQQKISTNCFRQLHVSSPNDLSNEAGAAPRNCLDSSSLLND